MDNILPSPFILFGGCGRVIKYIPHFIIMEKEW